MSRAFTLGQLDFIIYPMDHKPPHVHIKTTYGELVLEIETQEIMRSYGFTIVTVRAAQLAVSKHKEHLMEVWNEMQGQG